ncbi:hypothetical protein [Pantoea vagans]|uniref:hypothetical protein n=1 Tax=Pantoea vagans TaxID=470934 RepID=UPI003B018F43
MIIKRYGFPALLKTTLASNNALYALFLRKVGGQVNRLLCLLSVSVVFYECGDKQQAEELKGKSGTEISMPALI